jgi:hypothetical protein
MLAIVGWESAWPQLKPAARTGNCWQAEQRRSPAAAWKSEEGLLVLEVDSVGMALRLGKTKSGKSIRPVGSVVIAVKAASAKSNSKYVFPAITTHVKHHGIDPLAPKISAKDVPA